MKYLQKNNIEYISEFSIKNSPRKWRYDFYLPISKTLIEYHGKQHYQFTKHFHKNYKGFMKRIISDFEKKHFALKNGFNYIELNGDNIKNIALI